MTRVVVTETLLNLLGNLAQPLELCDAGGQVLARVLPASQVAHEGLEPPISQEEIQRRKLNKGKTYSTAAVLAHLEQR